jgi:hypothetical protein
MNGHHYLSWKEGDPRPDYRCENRGRVS